MASLSGSSGGKGPAASALSLVLDGSHGTFGSPIPRNGNIDIEFGEMLLLVSSDNWACSLFNKGSQIGLGELETGEIGESIGVHSVSLLGSVVLVDKVQILLKCFVSVEEDIVVVRLGVFVHPVDKGILVLSLREGFKKS